MMDHPGYKSLNFVQNLRSQPTSEFPVRWAYRLGSHVLEQDGIRPQNALAIRPFPCLIKETINDAKQNIKIVTDESKLEEKKVDKKITKETKASDKKLN